MGNELLNSLSISDRRNQNHERKEIKLPTIESREVAEMVGKEHSKLLRDIRNYCNVLNEAKIGLVNFFIESSYKDTKGEIRPCYLLTKQGCEMVANKMTGEKGILFTAKYVLKFNQMEEEIRPKIPKTYKEAIKELLESLEANEQLELENKQQKQIIGELKPKADYTDLILKSSGVVTITQIAKDYGMSGQKFNKALHDLGIQYSQSGQWLLYSKYHGKGYTHSETIPIKRSDGRNDVNMITKWTQKGRLFLYNMLKENGIFPMIEREEEAI